MMSTRSRTRGDVVEYCAKFRERIKPEIDAATAVLCESGAFDPLNTVRLAHLIGTTWRKELATIEAHCMDRDLFPELPTIKLYGCDGKGDFVPDVWLMVWRRGIKKPEGTSIHDHGTSQAGIYVVSGEVTEHIYKVDSALWFAGADALPFTASRRVLHKGDSAFIGAPYIHRMMDHRIEGCGVHVYAPPLDEQASYVSDGTRLFRSSRWVEETLSECA